MQEEKWGVMMSRRKKKSRRKSKALERLGGRAGDRGKVMKRSRT